MKKSHGPAFGVQHIDLSQCGACLGKAFTRGIFHKLPCTQCNASGWVEAETGHALPLDLLVSQLSLRLQRAEREIQQLKHPRATGPEAIYQDENRRGPSGTNRTLD